MNKFDCGAMNRPEGWIAFYRMVHHAENRVIRDGRHDVIFATEAEALKAANAEFFKCLNSPITGISSMGGNRSAKSRAELLFKTRPVEGERKAVMG